MFHVHRAERADALAAALGELLAAAPADPFATEIVAVPARGIERWLTQQLSARLGAQTSRGDGICAGIAFPSPAELVADAIAVASGITPQTDPWRPERLVWPLLEVVESSLDEAWAEPIATHLGHNADPPEPHRATRRLGVVRHLAALFDAYARHRPELVIGWSAGSLVEAAEAQDAGAPRSPSSAAWQAELWRRLRARITEPDPASRLAGACERLRAEPGLLALPERLFLFGLTRLPAAHVGVLRALAAGRELHLFLLHPSPALWDDVRAQLNASGGRVLVRRADQTAELAANPLLRSWGRDARELQLVLGSEDVVDHHHPLTLSEPATLLQRIQADVRADRRPPGAPWVGGPGAAELRAPLDPADRSIEIHSCHGPARQVEVIRDAVLHALAEDETLEPRDVIVMCPDIETFAPLIQATFGTTAPDPGDAPAADAAGGSPMLRVRLADRSLRQTNPVLATVAELLDLADQRLTASQVLDFADREPVRRRFRLDDDDLGRLQQWIADAGIRWGLDPAHRAPFKLEQVRGGTWSTGIDRILLGIAMTEDEHRLYGDVLPLDDVDSGAIDLAGRFAELVARLQAAVDALRDPQPVAAWSRSIAAAADALMATSGRDAYQRAQLQRLLDALLDEAHESSVSLELAELRALLADRLQGRPTRANFRTGSLTICTLVPMRSVPHRVVCLLGLDDGAFPRKAPHDGDDVMLEAPHLGERDGRSEDRQLLLDALLAARERLIITFTGNDERTNTSRPPAVPVGELLDTIDETVVVASNANPPTRAARDQVLVKHPLQPFDPRNFVAGRLIPQTPWSFDPVTLDGARALIAPRHEPTPFLEGPLPPLGETNYELDDLIRFVQHPVRAFLRRRLSVSLSDRAEDIADGLPVELDALERWDVGQRLLDALLAGVDERAAWLAEIRRGTLPPGELGRPVLTDAFAMAKAIAAVARGEIASGQRPASADVHVTLPNGRSLTGTVPGLTGDVVLSATFSRLAPRHRIAAWVRLLALTLCAPERELSAVTVGRGSRGEVARQRIRPLGEDAEQRATLAAEKLGALLDLFDRGMREPLPIFVKTSAAYALASARLGDPLADARKEWVTDWSFPREDQDLEHQLVLGGVVAFETLTADAPAADEYGAGWDPSEGTRFGRLAVRMWDGLLEFEELG